MVQLVFVHGVSVRDSDKHQKTTDEMKDLFSRFAFKGNALNVRTPYWGKHGADPKFEFASIPTRQERAATLAIGGGLGGSIGQGTEADPGDTLLNTAKDDFEAVVNTLSLALDSEDLSKAELAEGLATYALDLDGNVPNWLNDPAIDNDDQFLQRLELEVNAHMGQTGAATLGIGSALLQLGRSIVNGTSNLVNGPLANSVRSFTPLVGIFIGDVFAYLKDGVSRTEIRQTVEADILAAAKDAGANSEKLILIGHSFGGVVLHDLLSDEAWVAKIDTELGPDTSFQVDLLITIGSQPGLFEELNLFDSSLPEKKGERPKAVDRWWNIYDRVDILSFAAEKAFNGVVDFEADTIAGVINAHTAYLHSQIVHQKLNRRMKEVGLIA
ncbi:MAG: hypothetical protein AAF633_25650 [Chloroflexota bacterium]